MIQCYVSSREGEDALVLSLVYLPSTSPTPSSNYCLLDLHCLTINDMMTLREACREAVLVVEGDEGEPA